MPPVRQKEQRTPAWVDTIKFILPIAIASVGLYVSLVVAPLDDRVSRAETTLHATHEAVIEHKAKSADVLRRILYIESSLSAHRSSDHATYAIKEDILRELAILREVATQQDKQLRDVLRDRARSTEHTNMRPTR